MNRHLFWIGTLLVLVAGCTENGQTREGGDAEETSAGETAGAGGTLTVTSEAFEAEGAIPARYTGEGEDVPPPLAWSSAPAATKSFALICDDPDAPREEPWVHWVLYAIPAGTNALPEGGGGIGVEGANSWPDRTGYNGPLPPRGHGVHHYHFKVYALDAAPDPGPGASKQALLDAMEGHVLATGELVGTYERK